MAKIVIIGAGISGHTAASHFRRKLSAKKHEIVMISPNSKYQWVPSNVWVGVGRMTPKQMSFPLAPIYKKLKVDFKQAKVEAFYPEGDAESDKPFVTIRYINDPEKVEKVSYDYLVNATGPKLNFEATEGLAPGKNNCYSVCSYTHAEEAWENLEKLINEMKGGKRGRILIGTGNGAATCQGAAFEYIMNVDHELRRHKVRDMAEVTWISNEYELGDFGMDGVLMSYGTNIMKSKEMIEMLFEDRGIKWIKRAGVKKVDGSKAYYETLEDTDEKTEAYDFAMLIPAFSGHGFKAYDKAGADITEKLFKGFMLVDADYTPKPYEEWKAQDWPETYQNPNYSNIFACGIAFAPPHPISRPRKNKNGLNITPAPPRTGMPSGITAKVVVDNVVSMIKHGENAKFHKGSMANMGAACIASNGYGIFSGMGSSITTFPIVKDFEKYPDTDGRRLGKTFGSIGLAGHWLKMVLHYGFIYKAKLKPFWWIIPE